MKKALFLLICSVFLLTGCGGKKYGEELQNVADDILDNSAEIEGLLNEYSRIWSFSIESGDFIEIEDMANEMGISEDDINEYFALSALGDVPGDFSTNIYSLNSYYKETGVLDEIEKTSDEIKNKMSDLKKPPKGYEDVYDEVLEMYDLSEKYLEMALNPSGSLQEFNGSKNELTDKILSKHKRIEVIMP